MKIIDLRSDTVTKPSKAMRQAIANAEVGDDVWGDDPTVNKLQDICKELTGKPAALFVSSGCMANQLAVKCHTNPAEEIIAELNSHIVKYEIAGPAFISGVQVMPVAGVNGVLNADDVKEHIRPDWYHFPKTSLVCIENTHNRAGGSIYPIEDIKQISIVCKENNLKLHLDGARIFNASVETRISIMEYASHADSISFCFSKGLGAPVGSILCGETEFITKAHKFRKILGGGMRQAGILAAGAIYALEHNVERLKDDHKNAKHFAEEISKLDWVDIDPLSVQTNIVIFKTSRNAAELVKKFKQKNILLSNDGFSKLRAVFHLDVSEEQTEDAIKIFNTI
ncbi:MAG: low-specificity L-threonine aldolase [Ignavibacteria bacterium]|nr:low-specificity L-threonine aldolase [Ignavibacteria bacterium]